MHSRRRLHNLILCALFSALTALATVVVQIPSPLSGFINLGDCLVLSSSFLLGPVYGTVAAAIGSMLADLIAGYAIYAPATFVIKGCVALVACLLFRALARLMPRLPARLISATAGESVMVLGYFAYEALALGYGAGAVLGMPANAVQAIAGIALCAVLVPILQKTPYLADPSAQKK